MKRAKMIEIVITNGELKKLLVLSHEARIKSISREIGAVTDEQMILIVYAYEPHQVDQ